MRANVGQRTLSVLIVVLLLATGGALLLSKNAAATSGQTAAPVGGASPWNPLGGGQATVTGDDFERALAKIEPALREAAKSPQKGGVESIRIMTTNFGEARNAALALGAIAPISEESALTHAVAPRSTGKDLDYIIARDLKVSQSALIAIAKLPSTVSIGKALQPLLLTDPGDPQEMADWATIRPTLQQRVRQMAKDGIIANGGPIEQRPMDYGTVQVTGSAEVKANLGYTGSSVNLMVLDTGTDFGHPSFSASPTQKWATVTDPSSPWFGWPIMMDAGSLQTYFGQWDAGANPYPIGYSFGEATWYADTAYETGLVGTPLDATVDGAATEWTATHLRASDPVEGANGGEDVTDLYVAGGWDTNLDLVGHFFAFNTVPYIDGQTQYVINVDTAGQTTGYDVLADNNIPMTDLLIGGTAWETTTTLSIGPTDVVTAGSLYVYFDDPDPAIGTPFVEGVDYTYAPGTHVLTFMDTLYPNHDLYADYMYSSATISGGAFSQMNLIPGTETVYLDGAVWAPANYAINYAAGTIAFTTALGPNEVVDADYDYNAGGMTDPIYGGVTSATDFPEMVVAWTPAGGTEPEVYVWNDASGWAGPALLQTDLGGEFAYDPLNNFAEMFGPKPSNNDAYSILVEMYAANTTTAALVDTTPSDAAPLSNYVPADFGFLPYWHGLGGWTKRVAPDLGLTARINRNYNVGAAQMSLSGTYHLGVSPDDKLTNLWGERVGLLLVDLNTPGVYDTIFVDVDDDHNFADEKAVTKADPTAWQDITGDGYADLSSGILYWMPDPSTPVADSLTAVGGETSLNLSAQNVAIDIVPVGAAVTYTWPTVTLNGNPIYWMDNSADMIIGFDMDLGAGIINLWQYDLANDTFNPYALAASDVVAVNYRTGTPLPYSPTLSSEQGMKNFIPENGDIALFYGEFNAGDFHGTSTASAAAGKPFDNFFGIFDVFGTAEDAKLIGANFAGGNVALEFAGRGYDGIPGTGDEADVISNSWTFGGDLATTGFDANDRYVEYLTQLYPQTTYMFAASNEGWGYGTVTPAASAPDVIAVGGASMMNYRRLYDFFGLAGYDRGPVGCWPVLFPTDPCGPYGDMVSFSGRGPNGLGQPKPDVIALGAFGWASLPVNDWLDGANAFDLFSGTSWATPVAAGIAALIVDAYQDTHGGLKPSSAMVREFLKSGATDHGFDVLQQGSGFVNASMSVRMAMDAAGMSVSPSMWSPGGYPTPADHHRAFVNFLRPGESDSTTFTVTNHDTRTLAPTASAEYYTLQDSYAWDYQHANGATDYFTFASAPGVGGPVNTRYRGVGAGMNPEGNPFPGTSYANADFIAVHVTAHEVERVAAAGDSFVPGIEVHQWTDVNDDGLFDNVPERNRVTYPDGLSANYAAMKLWVHHPAARFDNAASAVTEGFVLRVRDFGSTVPVSYTVTIEFYGRSAWPWMTVTPLGSIAGGATATFTATANVPLGAAPGAYQGVIVVSYETNTSLVPVLINVPYTGFPVHLGGVTPTTSLYDNGAFRGIGGGQYTTGGDVRRFFAEFDIDTTRPDRTMLYELNWQHAYSDAELHIATAAPYGAGSFEEADPTVFGPNTLEVTAASKDLVGVTNTITGLGELLTGPLVDGLMLVTVESVQMQGDDLQEEFNVDIGLMETKTTTMDISTNQLAGSRPVTVWSNVPLIGGLATAVTQSSVDSFPNMPLTHQADASSFPAFGEWLCSMTAPNTKLWSVGPGTISISFHITSPVAADDHDLGVFRDENGNGVCDWGVDTFMGQDADGDSNEKVALDFPAVGDYLVQTGWYASVSNLWNLDIATTIIGVSAFSATGCPNTTIAPLTVTGCDIAWDFLGSTPTGPQSGSLFLSPGYAPFALAQKVTVNWLYDIEPPTIADALPLPNSMTANALQNIVANVYDNNTAQIDWRTIQLWVDNRDMTLLSKVIAPYVSTAGYNAATISLTPPAPLPDGVHVATVRAWDFAGNLGSLTWHWTVDTTGPMLDVTTPAVTEVSQQGALAMIAGTTEPGATVEFQIEGSSITPVVDPQGRFSGSVNLVSSGRHEILVVATDALGNSVAETLVFWYDDTAPTITWSVSPGTTTNADTAVLVGTVDETASLSINGIPVFVGADGSWSVTWLLSEGTNTAVIQAVDESGRLGTETVVVTRITAAPTITARAEIGGAPVTETLQDANTNAVDITGTATVASGTTLRFVLVNGAPATLGTGGTFTLANVPLNVGANVFHVQAQDSAGNWATASVTVSFSPIRLEISRSYNSVILIVVAVVLLIVGFFVGMMMGRKPSQPEAVPPGMPTEPMTPSMPAEEPMAPSPEEMPPPEAAEPPKEGMT